MWMTVFVVVRTHGNLLGTGPSVGNKVQRGRAPTCLVCVTQQ